MGYFSLLDRYDSQLRTDAEVDDAAAVVRLGPLLAAAFPARRKGFVTYGPFTANGAELDALIDSVIEHYEAYPWADEVEWKTRDHDHLPDLHTRLEHRGFVAGETETVMAGPVEAAIAAGAGLPESYRLEKADTEAALREAQALAACVFSESPEHARRKTDELVARLHREPESFEMWVVRDPAGQVVCSGRADFVDATDFVTFWGGACEKSHRRKGLYRAITAARAHTAFTRGKKFIQVDCTNYSRPILQKAGLTAITTTTPFIWTRP